MVSSSMLSLAASLFAGVAIAQQYPIASTAFQLRVTSRDGTSKYNQTTVGACHEGALVEGLCLNPGGGPVFFGFNTSSADAPAAYPGHTAEGILTTNSPGTNYSQAMSFNLPFSTNVAQAWFFPDTEAVGVNFDQDNVLNIVESYDDTHTPPTVDETYTPYYKFYACETNYAAYVYTTINWLYGTEPVNPSCSAITVERVYVAN